MGVLGLGDLRASVQVQTERLQKIVAGELKADEATLVEIAASLIGVEDKLDDSLVGLIRPKTEEAAEPGEDVEFQLSKPPGPALFQYAPRHEREE